MNIGLSQLGVPAPLALRRAVNGFIAIIQPATTALIAGMPEDMISKDAKVLLLIMTSYVGTIAKWLEYIIGVEPAKIEETKQDDPK